MNQAIDTGLPKSRAPMEWATLSNGILFTAQIPIDANGSVIEGSVTEQAKQTLENLKSTVEAAGGTLGDVTQVLIYVTSPEFLPEVNGVYAQYFAAPYPNRAAMVVSALARPDMKVEMIAYAGIEQS